MNKFKKRRVEETRSRQRKDEREEARLRQALREQDDEVSRWRELGIGGASIPRIGKNRQAEY